MGSWREVDEMRLDATLKALEGIGAKMCGLELCHVRRVFDERVAFGDKEGAEALYQGVYELREWMNRVHAGTVWRREVP